MCLAKNIRFLRKRANLSQEDIAKRLGYKSFTTIQKWESGVAEPSVLIVRKLAEIFNVDMNALTTLDIEEMESQPKTNGYYLDPETAKKAQELFDDPNMRILFDAARDARPEDLQKAADYLKAVKAMELGLDNGEA